MYNYRHFRSSDYQFTREVGPAVGEELDFEARTLQGKRVCLRDLRGQPVVLETGSVTCGIYADKVDWWHAIAERHPEARFLVLYVREAHPGERTDAHQAWQDKRDAAARLETEWGEWREVWVDDLEGTAHRMLGALPVMMYVLDSRGRIALRANWSDPTAADQVLEALRRGEATGGIPVGDPLPSPLVTLRSLMKGGLRAFVDFARAAPALVAKRIRYRRHLRARAGDA
jgi:hypothetical protein